MNTIVKSSSKIKESLIARWKELGITRANVIRDAIDRGMPINRKGKGEVNEKVLMQTLSRTLNGGQTGLTEEQLIWLCYRYSITVFLDINIITPHNEKEALRKLSIIFPNKTKTKK
jgi:hypothetical protein